MTQASIYDRLGRVRRPRVHITYEVDTDKGLQKVELPFVTAVIADLSAQTKEALKPLKERQFVPIDRDTFNDVLAKSAPRLALKVKNRLTDEDNQIACELTFRQFGDFEPEKIARQIGPLQELLTLRQALTELLNKTEGNDHLERLLSEVMNDAPKARRLAQLLDDERHGLNN